MTIRTAKIESLINSSFNLRQSELYCHFYLSLEKLYQAERKIVSAHNLIPLANDYGFARLEYNNQYYFDYGSCERTVSLQESFYPAMDEFIHEYTRMKNLVTGTREFLEDLLKTAYRKSDVLTLIPSIFNDYQKSTSTCARRMLHAVHFGTEPLTPEKIQQFNEKHSDILNTYKIIQLELLTR